MEKNINFGFIQSELDGTEHIFGVPEDVEIPKSYTYRPYMPSIIDQGSESICVPCSISAFLNWKENIKDGEVKDNGVDLHEIYNCRTNAGEGMTFKEAFHYLRHEGVSTEVGKMKINEYGMVKSFMGLKYAIIANGPCVGALRVYNSEPDFWNRRGGESYKGGHAISIVGYDEDGFIIRNSWGKSFGDEGYTKISYEEFDKFMEVWTVIG